MTAKRQNRSALAAMYAGLALTVVAMIAPYLDRAGSGGLAGHLRAGYPGYSRARIDTAVNTYLIYLSVVGAVGIAGWLATIWAVRAGKRWARWVATGIFALAAALALADLLIKDTSGDTGLPPMLGWLGVLPCVAGLLAVGLLSRRS